MEIFSDGLNEALQTAANVVTVGGLLDKTYTEAKDILDRILRNHEDQEDNDYGSRLGCRRSNNSGVPGNDTVTALQTQLIAMTNLLQTMTMNQVNAGNGSQVNAVNLVVVISCIGCSEPHTFDMCP